MTPIYADPLTQAIQRLNSNLYNLTKDECIQVIRELRDELRATQAPAVGDDDARDAARYRFIRDADRSDHAIDFTMLLSLALDSMDSAIDKAMQMEKQQ